MNAEVRLESEYPYHVLRFHSRLYLRVIFAYLRLMGASQSSHFTNACAKAMVIKRSDLKAQPATIQASPSTRDHRHGRLPSRTASCWLRAAVSKSDGRPSLSTSPVDCTALRPKHDDSRPVILISIRLLPPLPVGVCRSALSMEYEAYQDCGSCALMSFRPVCY